MIRAVFLDREGVITPKFGPGEYLLRAEEAVIAPGVTDALRRLQSNGIALFIVSNQSCVGRGIISQAECDALHAIILGELADEGVTIAASRICPHTDADACACRKPKPGMILDLANGHGISPAHSAMIGDSPTDVDAGTAAGCAEVFLIGNGLTLAGAVDQLLSERT